MPNEVEKNAIGSEANRGRFNFARLEKIKTEKNRLEKFDNKIYKRKKLKLRSPLGLGEEILILTSWTRKKDVLGRIYKSSIDSKPYFHNQETFLIRNRQKIEEKIIYWQKSTETGKNLKFRFQRKKSLLFQAILIDFYVVFRRKLTKKNSSPKKNFKAKKHFIAKNMSFYDSSCWNKFTTRKLI